MISLSQIILVIIAKLGPARYADLGLIRFLDLSRLQRSSTHIRCALVIPCSFNQDRHHGLVFFWTQDADKHFMSTSPKRAATPPLTALCRAAVPILKSDYCSRELSQESTISHIDNISMSFMSKLHNSQHRAGLFGAAEAIGQPTSNKRQTS